MLVYSILGLAIAGLAALYALNYARWALRQRLVRGAVGLVLLAGATIGLPLYVVLTR